MPSIGGFAERAAPIQNVEMFGQRQPIRIGDLHKAKRLVPSTQPHRPSKDRHSSHAFGEEQFETTEKRTLAARKVAMPEDDPGRGEPDGLQVMDAKPVVGFYWKIRGSTETCSSFHTFTYIVLLRIFSRTTTYTLW